MTRFVAGSEEAGEPPQIREAFERTVRLVSSARLREAVMAPLTDNDEELALLAEIEGATSSRLIAEERGFGGLTADELVHGVPHARFINASFASTNKFSARFFDDKCLAESFSAKLFWRTML